MKLKTRPKELAEHLYYRGIKVKRGNMDSICYKCNKNCTQPEFAQIVHCPDFKPKEGDHDE